LDAAGLESEFLQAVRLGDAAASESST
jgi:hypothetical protein